MALSVFKTEASTPSMVWGWCEEPSAAGPFPAGLYCISAMGITEDICQKFDGCFIESIIVNKGYYTESDPKIDVMLFKGTEEYIAEWDYYSLKGEKPFMQMSDLPFPGEKGEWVEFPLEEPYMIEAGNPIYVGWGYLNLDDNNLPLVSDEVFNDNPNTSWMTGDLPESMTYDFWANNQTAGANCIRIRLSGDNLPSDDVALTEIEAPRFVSLGQSAEISFTVRNQATSVINSLEISYAVAGEEATNITINGLDLQPGNNETLKLDNIILQKEGNLNLEVKVITVNGNEDFDESNNLISASVLCLAEGNGFNRNVVVEEGTGTWCGNCPRGIVGMREMAKKYPDNFIGIAVHDGDKMEIEAYWPYLDRYMIGYPYSTVDRAISGDPNFSELESNFLKEAAVPALAEVTISGISIEDNCVKFTPSVVFAASENDTEYGWAYVITEDNVGPYLQTNYYTVEGSLEGWDETKEYVLMTYDEVAAAAESVMGDYDLPTTIEAGNPYTQDAELNAQNVNDFTYAHLIAMVINKTTGYIENATKVSLSDYTGIKSINSNEAAKFEITNGKVTMISGEKAIIYSSAGLQLGILKAGDSIDLAKGIYVIKTGKSAEKLFIK